MAEMKSILDHVFNSHDHNMSFVVIIVVIVVVVNISHSRLLLQNDRANFNKTWPKLFLGVILSSTVSIYSTLIAIVLRDYDAVF